MQNSPNHKLPRWLSLTIILVFFGHFAIITIYHFSRYMLPEKLWFRAEHYISPWFYQHFMAFAPEPPMETKVFLYRTRSEEGWSRWQYPAYVYLQEHWSNPFGPALKMHDMLSSVAENLYKTANHVDLVNGQTTLPWSSLPAMNAAERFIAIHETENIDSFQVVVFIEKHILTEDSILERDSLVVFSKSERHD